MLFREEIEKKCYNCLYKEKLSYDNQFLCKFKGVVPPQYSCKKFAYDAFHNPRKKRRTVDTSQFSAKDFEL